MNRSFYQLRRDVADDWTFVRCDDSQVVPAAEGRCAVVKSQIAAIDPTVPVEIETLNEDVSKLADRPRFETALLGFFCILRPGDGGDWAVWGDLFCGGAANQEIGVRMALGGDAGGHSASELRGKAYG